MNGRELLIQFTELPVPGELEAANGLLTATPIVRFDQHRIGKDALGEPVLLLRLTSARPSAQAAPIRLQHLAVLFGVECRLRHRDGVIEQGRFTVVALRNSNTKLRSYFFDTAASLVGRIGATPTEDVVSECVRSLVELFRALSALARKSVQGVWAEVFVIERSANPRQLAECWHLYPDALHDFTLGVDCLEVKSSAASNRHHHFSLEQLRPSTPKRVVVASVLVEPSANGTTLATLLARVRSRLRSWPLLTARVDAVVAATLGETLPDAIGEPFNYQLASESFACFPAESVPCVNTPLPEGVSAVKFCADLRIAQAIEPTQYDDSELFRALSAHRA